MMNYTDFKSMILESSDVQHKEKLDIIGSDKYYTLYVMDAGELIECDINSIDNPTEVAEYESTFQQSATTLFIKRDATGNQIVAPTIEDVQGLYPKKQMFKNTIESNQINIYDYVVTEEKRLCGGEYWVSTSTGDISIDDYVEFSIVDKDDILGLFSMYGLSTSTGDVLELTKFVITDYAKKNKINSNEYHTQCYEGIKGTNAVYPGLYFRAYYHSYGSDNAVFMWRLYYYE